MKYGLAVFLSAEGVGPGELAVMAEERGFESLFLPEHSHIPASRESHQNPDAGDLPSHYWNTPDPFVALTAAACSTTRLRVGTGICLVVQRDPLILAKEVATLDRLSGGRFLFGVGAGWNLEEMRNHGTDPAHRFRLLRERVEAMKAIWTEDEASYDGRYVQFDRIWAAPKPAQRPHPPVLVGGRGPHAIDRVLAYGDEWLPSPEEGLVDRIQELQERARQAGRSQGMPVTVYGVEPADVARLAEAGVHRCIFWLSPGLSREVAERELDELAAQVKLSVASGEETGASNSTP